jgi:hypothetical protein
LGNANVDHDIVRQYLNKLVTLGVISYLPQKRSHMVIFFEERLDEKSIYISKEHYQVLQWMMDNNMVKFNEEQLLVVVLI